MDVRISYIDTNKALEEACQLLSQSELMALDTEFFRETTYYPVPSLIQNLSTIARY